MRIETQIWLFKKRFLPGFFCGVTKKKILLAVPMPNKCCATEKAGPTEDGVLRPEGRDERIHELTPPASIHADEAEIQCESAEERDDGDGRRMMKRLKKWGAK